MTRLKLDSKVNFELGENPKSKHKGKLNAINVKVMESEVDRQENESDADDDDDSLVFYSPNDENKNPNSKATTAEVIPLDLFPPLFPPPPKQNFQERKNVQPSERIRKKTKAVKRFERNRKRKREHNNISEDSRRKRRRSHSEAPYKKHKYTNMREKSLERNDSDDNDTPDWIVGKITRFDEMVNLGFVQRCKYDNELPFDFDKTKEKFRVGDTVRFRIKPDVLWGRKATEIELTILPKICEPQRTTYEGETNTVHYRKTLPKNRKKQLNLYPYLTSSGETKHDAEKMVQKTKINVDENRSVEFKLYINAEIKRMSEVAEKYATGFLNSLEGGTLYFGIHDRHVIYGLTMNSKERDQ
eukprot:UN32577